MGLFDRIRGKQPAPQRAAEKPAEASKASSPLGPPAPGVPEPAKEANPEPARPAAEPGGKGILSRLGQGMLGPLDNYVDEKADEILQDATVRAEQFRAETLTQVKTQAMDLLDVAEKRIDEKLVSIEKLLEERMRAEIRMKLRALVWTLLFVLLMAAISIGYVWFKRHYGLDAVRDKAPPSGKDVGKA